MTSISPNKERIVIFGAGRIGRSFVGQLFSMGGYDVVFVDISEPLIRELNRLGEYKVVIKSDQEEILWIRSVSGVFAGHRDKVIHEVAEAGILAVCVGQSGLKGIIPLIAGGLRERFSRYPDKPLDIIIAENLRHADQFFRQELTPLLPSGYPFERLVGLVETSIGKMVPIMPEKEVRADILQVFAEPYNTLILDRKGFKNPIPAIEGLAPKENMKAWVDRKLFIHNLGHATAAYLGFREQSGLIFMYEVLDIPAVYQQTRDTMLQAAAILMKRYPGEFTLQYLTLHIDDLLHRFRNRALGDTVYRVGCDLMRKLSPDDRLAGAIHAAIDENLPYDLILESLVCGFEFKATDPNGRMFEGDLIFHEQRKLGVEHVLAKVCGFDQAAHPELFARARALTGA
jgi:mannitol-1-phosphate 5-dehydrogenase